MTPEEIPTVLTTEQMQAASAWWDSLTPPWKRAFNEMAVKQSVTDPADILTVFTMQHLEVVRFAGPRAPFPNMTFELEDLSGLRNLPDIKIVVVNFHQLTGLNEIGHLHALESLFVMNNQLTSIEGVETLMHLKEFYFTGNQVQSLLPLTLLTQLHTIYCNQNKIQSLEGVGEQHRGQLKQFVCLPNERLPDSEIIRMERETGIRCLKG